MNKVATYLQSHISGDVLAGVRVRDEYSRDGSVLTIAPSMVVYPRTTNDIRKTARFAWQLAEKGHTVPITMRGYGSDTSGAAIGKGIIISTTAHMGRILELDTKQRLVRVQPGLNMRSLQETLHTHGLFLPVYPPSYQYSTIGGAIANNAGGEKSHKYGDLRQWVERLEVVLANGEVIQTGKVSKKELGKKKGLPTLEGEIYRAVDGLIADHHDALKKYRDEHAELTRDNVGYALDQLIAKDGSCDLTPLFVGSQGTLGIITEAIVRVLPYSPRSDLIVAAFDSVETCAQAVESISTLGPSSIELINDSLIKFVHKERGVDPMGGIFEAEVSKPAAVLFVEFDDNHDRKRGKLAKKAYKLLAKLASGIAHSDDAEQQEKLWSLRASSLSVLGYDKLGKAGVPIIDDVIVPPARFEQLMTGIKQLGEKHRQDLAVWGHAGEANLHAVPILDLGRLGDRQRVFKLMDDYYKMVVGLGGSIAAENNDGRLRAAYVPMQVGEELAEAYTKLRNACDPHGMLNPGVKTGTDLNQLVDILRSEYSLARFADYLPRM